MPRNNERPGGNRRTPRSSSSSSRPSSGGFRKRPDDGGEERPRFRGKPGGFRKDASSGSSSDGENKRPRRSFRREGGDERKSARPFGARPDRGEGRPFKKSFGSKEGGEERGSSRPYGARPDRGEGRPFKKSYGDKEGGEERRSSRPYGARPDRGEGRPFKKSFGDKEGGEERRSSRPYGARPDRGEGRPFKKSYGDKEGGEERRSSRPYGARAEGGDRPFKKSFGDRPTGKTGGRSFGKRPFNKEEGSEEGGESKRYSGRFERKSFGGSRLNKQRKRGPSKKESRAKADDGLIRLNKFISNSGICSRREADERIKMGLVTVNGITITEMGHKVKPTDEVRYEGKKLKAEKPVYILVNKPKGYITTTDDPQERNTVMHLIEGACKERVYPVGRLDRNTTGLLLLTNDGELADKLTHPSYNVKKIYKVELDKPITKADFEKIREGVHLEEGKAVPDDLAIVDDDNKTVGIELHIGWNRIVRRIFEALEYEVVKLDRVVYAGLDKKTLGRGEWRFLREEEVIRLKHLQ